MNQTVVRIGVLRALQLGDMLCAVPALRALRAAFPRAHITLIGLPWARAFAQRYAHYIDDHLSFPGFPGMPETTPELPALPGFLADAQARQFDLLLQMHGSGELSNPVAACLGAHSIAGFRREGAWSPDPARFPIWDEKEHEIGRWLRLLAHLGIPSAGTALEFPLTAQDRRALRLADARIPPPGSYACIHPGSQLPSRRWPPERFAAVADLLARRGLYPIITGTREEAGLTAAVRVRMRMPALDLAGKTELGGLAALISGAAAVVCNDTSVSHIAAAFGTPSVVICSGADPGRWAPLDRRRHRVLHHPVACRPCAHAVCPIAGHPCAAGVSVELVRDTLRTLLDGVGAAQFRPIYAAPAAPAFHERGAP